MQDRTLTFACLDTETLDIDSERAVIIELGLVFTLVNFVKGQEPSVVYKSALDVSFNVLDQIAKGRVFSLKSISGMLNSLK